MDKSEILDTGRRALSELSRHGVPLLESTGARGVPGNACTCIVARYLAIRTGERWTVHYSAAVLRSDLPPDAITRDYVKGNALWLDPDIIEIIRNFDQGEYPQLEAKR